MILVGVGVGVRSSEGKGEDGGVVAGEGGGAAICLVGLGDAEGAEVAPVVRGAWRGRSGGFL